MATQYVGSNGLTSSTVGWVPTNCTLTATSEGGKVRSSKAGYKGIYYSMGDGRGGKSRGSDPNLVTGKQYALYGVRIRRDTVDAGDVRVWVQDRQRDVDNPAVSLVIPRASMPLGQWVNVPNLVTPLVWNGPLALRVGIETVHNADDLDFTLTHMQVYQAAQVPSGYVLDPQFSFSTDYLRATFTDAVFGGAVPTSWAWDFGDGTPVVVGRNPIHDYTVGGTYNVKLTLSNGVNPDKSKTQAVTVAAPAIVPPPPEPPPVETSPPPAPTLNPYTDQLSLQVHTDPPEGVPVNLIANPNGELGSWGWVTPVAGSIMRGVNDPDGFTGWQPALLYEAQTGVANTFYSEPYPVDEGVYINASWRVMYVGNFYRQRIGFLDANFNLISQSAQTGYRFGLGYQDATPAITPPGTVYARVRFDVYANNTGSVYLAAGWKLAIREVTLSTGPDAASVDPLPYQPDSAQWTDILGPTHELHISRHELDVGTLSAVVLDADLDPVNAPDMRPGNRVRVQAPNADTRAWENIFEGRIDNALVSYVPRVRIELTATDNVTALANTPRPEGVETIAELPYLFEGGGVPWMVNDSGDQVPAAAVVSVNDNAKLIDQLAITRDTALGYAWVDRYNVVRAYDNAAMPATPVGLLDEDDYSDLDIGFDTHQLINVVTVKWLRYDAVSGETTEIPYGPYIDADSVAEWGNLTAEFTVHGAVEDEAWIEGFANVVLAANSVPVRRVNSMRIPIRSSTDIVKGKALLDLYDLVTTSHAGTDTTRDLRVTGIGHEIAADPRRLLAWSMNLSFTVDESVATPQQTPPPPVTPAAEPVAATTAGGSVTATTVSDGTAVFAHTLGAIPSAVTVAIEVAGGGSRFALVTAKTATTFTVQFYNGANVALAGGSTVTVGYIAHV